MTVDDRIREASEATRASFAQRPIREIGSRDAHHGAQLALAMLVVVAVLGVSGAVAISSRQDSQVTAGAGDGAGAGAQRPATTPSSTPIVESGDATPVDAGPLSPRSGQSVVWTGREVIVWGGWGDETGRVKFADGAAYDPATAHWRKIAASPLAPRRNQLASWTGKAMVVFGGDGRSDGAAYDPQSDSWQPLPPAPFPVGGSETLEDEGRASTSSALYIWDISTDRIAVYDFTAAQWKERPGPGFGELHAGVLRVVGDRLVALATTAYTGSHLLTAVSGSDLSGWTRLHDGEFPTTTSVPDVDPKWSAAVAGRVIAWSDTRQDAVLSLNLDNGTWKPDSPHQLPSCEGAPAPVPLGSDFVASSCGTTVKYAASSGTWHRLDLGNLTVDERETVWTGRQLVSWGLTCCYGTGGSPFAQNDAWSYPIGP